jgi:hypothetical protein
MFPNMFPNTFPNIPGTCEPAFALSSTVKTPSKKTNETFDEDNSTNLSYSEARSVYSKISDTEISMLSGFSSPSETDNL